MAASINTCRWYHFWADPPLLGYSNIHGELLCCRSYFRSGAPRLLYKARQHRAWFCYKTAMANKVYYKSLLFSCAYYFRLGTALAFLVQACLVKATGIAYVQWVWRRCRQKPIQIGSIDAAFGISQDVFMFLKPGFVLGFPIPAGLALIFWYTPSVFGDCL